MFARTAPSTPFFSQSHPAPFIRVLKWLFAPLLVAALASCAAPSFKADVSRFQSQLPAPVGQSFAVVSDDPALAGGIEFSQYARLVGEQMTRQGYRPAQMENADLLVRFTYGVDKGRERVRSSGFYDPFYDRYGRWGGRWGRWGRVGAYRPRRSLRSSYYRGRAWGYGFYDPWFGGSELRRYTIYTSGLEMKIDRRADNARLFEGRAQAVSTSNRLQYLVPNLVEAMFTEFPGNSGETLRISIRPEDVRVRNVN